MNYLLNNYKNCTRNTADDYFRDKAYISVISLDCELFHSMVNFTGTDFHFHGHGKDTSILANNGEAKQTRFVYLRIKARALQTH